jgi:hypothetical protein
VDRICWIPFISPRKGIVNRLIYSSRLFHRVKKTCFSMFWSLCKLSRHCLRMCASLLLWSMGGWQEGGKCRAESKLPMRFAPLRYWRRTYIWLGLMLGNEWWWGRRIWTLHSTARVCVWCSVQQGMDRRQRLHAARTADKSLWRQHCMQLRCASCPARDTGTRTTRLSLCRDISLSPKDHLQQYVVLCALSIPLECMQEKNDFHSKFWLPLPHEVPN